jgi:hypothetical protein
VQRGNYCLRRRKSLDSPIAVIPVASSASAPGSGIETTCCFSSLIFVSLSFSLSLAANALAEPTALCEWAERSAIYAERSDRLKQEACGIAQESDDSAQQLEAFCGLSYASTTVEQSCEPELKSALTPKGGGPRSAI